MTDWTQRRWRHFVESLHSLTRTLLLWTIAQVCGLGFLLGQELTRPDKLSVWILVSTLALTVLTTVSLMLLMKNLGEILEKGDI